MPSDNDSFSSVHLHRCDSGAGPPCGSDAESLPFVRQWPHTLNLPKLNASAESELIELTRKSVQHRYDVVPPKVHFALAQREALKVLSAVTYKTDVRNALANAPKDAQTRLFERVAEHLAPAEAPPRKIHPDQYLNPIRWKIPAIRTGSPLDPFLRLTFIASAMLVQEQGLKKAGTSVDKALQLPTSLTRRLSECLSECVSRRLRRA